MELPQTARRVQDERGVVEHVDLPRSLDINHALGEGEEEEAGAVPKTKKQMHVANTAHGEKHKKQEEAKKETTMAN